MAKNTKIPPELEDLADQVGEFIEYWGFKKVHGRIWLHLFVASHPLDAGQLIERLGVSKALISMSLGDLLEYEVIEEVGKSDRGTLLYRANPQVTNVILNVLRRREKRMLARISSSYRLVSELSKVESESLSLDAERLGKLGEMIATAESSLEALVSMSDIDFAKLKSFNL